MGRIVISFFLGLSISACIASQFPYKYYVLDADSYAGQLKGPSVDQDIVLKMCQPTKDDKAPCLVMFTSAFMRLKEAHQKCLIDLDSIQRTVL